VNVCQPSKLCTICREFRISRGADLLPYTMVYADPTDRRFQKITGPLFAGLIFPDEPSLNIRRSSNFRISNQLKVLSDFEP
jgi:hypothetical protein